MNFLKDSWGFMMRMGFIDCGNPRCLSEIREDEKRFFDEWLRGKMTYSSTYLSALSEKFLGTYFAVDS
jgi:hypothetical protein